MANRDNRSSSGTDAAGSVGSRQRSLCDHFEQAWRTGHRPCIEEYIAAIELPPADRHRLLVELVMIDLAYRWQITRLAPHTAPSTHDRTSRGGLPRTSKDEAAARWRLVDYVRRLPDLGPLEQLPIALVVEEYRARRLAGERPDITEYTETFARNPGELRQLLAAAEQSLSAVAATSAPRANPEPAGRQSPSVQEQQRELPDDAQVADQPTARPGVTPASGHGQRNPGLRDRNESDEVAELRAGDCIDHFCLKQLLGSGTFAHVWKAYDTELHRFVALKIPRNDYLTREETEAFLHEARAAAILRHAGIVSVYEVGRHGNRVFIVQQLIEGAPLDHWLTQNDVSPRQAASLIVHIADVLHVAHQAGIVHRDLKPSNILMDGDGQPHITDFGLAKFDAATQSVSCAGQLMGTPAYMAPEQARAESHLADRRTDVFALGIILYQILTGERPFRGHVEHIVRAILNDDPTPPGQLNHHVPRDLSTICLKCLEKSPDRRYQTAADLGEDLRRHLEGRPILARPTGPLTHAARWCRRNAVVAALTGLVAVLLIAVAVTATIGYFHASRLLQRVETNHYFSQIAAAQQHWNENHIDRLRATLADCPSAHREWDWGYLHSLTHTEQSVLKPAGAWVLFSVDGRHILTAGGPQRDLRIWETRTGKCLGRFPDSYGRMGAIAMTPDGTRVAATDVRDGSIRVWDIATRRRIARWQAHSKGVYRIQYTRDAQRIVCFRQRQHHIQIWDVDARHLVREIALPGKRVVGGCLSPDSTNVAVGLRDGTIHVFQTSDGKQIAEWVASDSGIGKIAWSPDGKRVAVTLKSGNVRVWQVATGRLVTTCVEHAGSMSQVVFSHDGTRIACAGRNNTVHIWNARTGHLVATMRGHDASIRGVVFSRDDRWLAASAFDNTVRVWDTIRGSGVAVLPIPPGFVYAMAFSPRGDELAVGTATGEIRRYDVEHLSLAGTIAAHDQQVTAIAYSPTQQWLASAGRDGMVKIYDARQYKLHAALAIRSRTNQPAVVRCLAFAPDGDRLICVGTKSTLQSWDARTKKKIWSVPCLSRDIRAVAICPNKPWFAVANHAGRIEIRDSNTGRLLRKFAAGKLPLWSVSFSPDGNTLAAGASDGSFFFWDASTWRLRNSVGNSLIHCRVTLAFAPTGRRFVTAVAGGIIDLWDATTCRPIMTLFSSARVTPAVAFSPDGRRIAAATTDGRLLVWTADSIVGN